MVGPRGGGFPKGGLEGSFFRFYSLLFQTWLTTGFFLDLGGVLEPQIGPQTCFWDVFWDPFFEGILESIFFTIF